MTINRFDFALIRYVPDYDRGEGLNVGVLVRNSERLCMEWNIEFSAPASFTSKWTGEEMTEWRNYYKREFDLSPGLFSQNVNKLSEEFWETIRRKVRGAYVLGPTRRTLTKEMDLDNVAMEIMENLVVHKKKKKQEQSKVAVKRFLQNEGFEDNRFFRHPIQKNYPIQIKKSVTIRFPYYQENGVYRPILFCNTNPQEQEVADETSKQLGKISLAHEFFDNKEKETEFIVIIDGVTEPDANYRALELLKAKPYLFQKEEEREKLREHLSEVCEPIDPTFSD